MGFFGATQSRDNPHQGRLRAAVHAISEGRFGHSEEPKAECIRPKP
jgi:hypothetical protein